MDAATQTATFGGGCFWCTEHVFKALRGVHSVESGYAGGSVGNPSYEQICSKTTGHAEVVRIEFDPERLAYEDLLRVFWHTHDPTTLNQQGADRGPQYRSVVFYHDDEQAASARKVLAEIDQSALWPQPIVTALEPLSSYYSAEDHHQDFFEQNPTQGYCLMSIPPKIEKLREHFPDLLME
jgi:peptide-methionine (S)-S-oxide reductase